MALTVAEALRGLEIHKLERVVWMEVVNFLSAFVDEEVRKANRLMGADDCLAETVPQDLIKALIKEVNDKRIAPLNQKVDALEGLQVQEETNDDNDGGTTKRKKTTRKKTTKRDGGKASGKKATPSGSTKPSEASIIARPKFGGAG